MNSRLRVKSTIGMALPLLGILSAFQAPEQSETVFRSETRLVVLHASAEDKDGHLVNNLSQSVFQVFENGVKQEIKGFRQEDVPVSLGLVIDSSASMTKKRDRVAAAALALVKLSNPEDEVFIVNFDEAPSLGVDFTNDLDRLKSGLAHFNARGGTALRDAVRTAVEHLKGRDKKDKKVLVVVTDGADNASLSTLDFVIRAAQQSEVTIYTIGLLSDESPREAEKAKTALETLARATGGQNYFPVNVSEIDRIAPEIAHEIRNQYILSYVPTNQELDGSFRQIRVVVNSPKVASVRTRTGYYATPNRQRPGPTPGSDD